jgi:hypothetical protein
VRTSGSCRFQWTRCERRVRPRVIVMQTSLMGMRYVHLDLLLLVHHRHFRGRERCPLRTMDAAKGYASTTHGKAAQEAAALELEMNVALSDLTTSAARAVQAPATMGPLLPAIIGDRPHPVSSEKELKLSGSGLTLARRVNVFDPFGSLQLLAALQGSSYAANHRRGRRWAT